MNYSLAPPTPAAFFEKINAYCHENFFNCILDLTNSLYWIGCRACFVLLFIFQRQTNHCLFHLPQDLIVFGHPFGLPLSHPKTPLCPPPDFYSTSPLLYHHPPPDSPPDSPREIPLCRADLKGGLY